MRRRVLGCVLAVGVLAGCGGSPAPATPTTGTATAPPATSTPSPATAPAGSAVVAALGAHVSAGPASTPAVVDKEAAVAIGDTVATDATGLGELRFADASLARLGKNTSLVVTEMTAAAVQRTRLTLAAGDTWHEVTKLTAPNSTYEVLTPVGVAAVRGTRFAVTCHEQTCVITVIDGMVRFTPTAGPPADVTAAHRLTVTAGVASAAPVPVTAAELAADPWIQQNLAGAPSVSATPTATGARDFLAADKVCAILPLSDIEGMTGGHYSAPVVFGPPSSGCLFNPRQPATAGQLLYHLRAGMTSASFLAYSKQPISRGLPLQPVPGVGDEALGYVQVDDVFVVARLGDVVVDVHLNGSGTGHAPTRATVAAVARALLTATAG